MSEHQDSPSFFQKSELIAVGKSHHQAYTSAQPFPHIVLDDFFPETIVHEIATAFESKEAAHWGLIDHARSVKQACADESLMDPRIRAFLHYLNSGPFLLFLEALTGIEGLLADPHFQGAGMHRIERGGFLKIHADFNYQKKLKVERRLNLLLYLNKDWQEGYGGHLELWDRDMQGCVQKILPVFNRCVIFSTTDNSYHGHPEPLRCPPEMARKSLALYYYTAPPADGDLLAPHSTLYQLRPGEEDPDAGMQVLRPLLRGLRWITPPIITELVRRVRSR